MTLTENSLKILGIRYLLPGETPEGLFKRVSLGNPEYEKLMVDCDFLPNSPTLFNAGTDMGTLSACFKFDVPDDMHGIMDVAKKAALVQKWGGGVGYCLSALRPEGSLVATTHRYAGGPVSFLKLYHAVAECITQGGKRNGAQMAILHVDHPDIRKFIHCKDENPQALSTFNISVALTDDFMNKATESPAAASPERDLLWEMAESAWKTGDPGCYFIDTSEQTNPTSWLGELTGTNPCGEVPLLDNEPCNLGSINLGNHVQHFENFGTSVDWRKLESTTRIATRFLDDILDHNQFPHEDIAHAAFRTRKLGLGVMGWADMLALLHIHYDSEQAISLAAQVMSCIDEWACDESVNLAIHKGHAPWYLDAPSIIKDGMVRVPRNATRTCIAPTGTISIIAGASMGIEPHVALTWQRQVDDANKTILEERVPVLDRCGDFVPHTALDIDWKWHVRHQAAFQKHTDLAVSKTINMDEAVSVQDVFNTYVMMWSSGCKGGTIYRNNSRPVQVLNVKPPIAQRTSEAPEPVAAVVANGRNHLPTDRAGLIHKFNVGEQEGYLTVGLFEDGSPGEVFITTAKVGSTVRGLYETIGILTSVSLQYGVPLDALTRVFQNIEFEPRGLTRNPEIPTATSVVDYIFHWLRHTFLPQTKITDHVQLAQSQEPISVVVAEIGLLCPDCGALAIPAEGCWTCSRRCGWSKC